MRQFCFLFSSCFFSTGMLLAEHDLSSRVTILESQMQEVSVQTASGNIGAKTAAASPLIHGHHCFVTADFLYWNLEEGGTDYVISNTDNGTGVPFKGKRKNLEFGWDPGFRLGFGKIFDHDRWDTYFNYTWFQTRQSTSAEAHDGGALFALLGIIQSPLRTAHLKMSFEFNAVDWELGRHYFVSHYLSLRPFVGLKTAWIDQHRHSHYDVLANSDEEFSTRGKCQFWGIGPWAGFQANWHFCEHLSFFGKAAGSIMWGDFDAHEKQSDSIDGVWLNYKVDQDRIVPMAQFQLGFSWETNLKDACYHLALNFSYEVQYWWQQNQFPYYPGPTVPKMHPIHEDLSLQGLTFDVRLDF